MLPVLRYSVILELLRQIKSPSLYIGTQLQIIRALRLYSI